MTLTELADDELDALRVEVLIEQERRAALVNIPLQMEAANRAYLAAEGVTEGAPYDAPTGYQNAYPLGFTVTHNGKTWKASRNGATGEPGVVLGDWTEVVPENVVPEWRRPQAGQEYAPGAVVSHNGRLWKNTHTGPNGWEPGTQGAQWTDIGLA